EANENKLQADILTAINSNIQSKLIGKYKNNGLVTYNTISNNDSILVVFALNKNETPQKIVVNIHNFDSIQNADYWSLYGNSEFDADIKFELETNNTTNWNTLEAILKPQSINILKLTLDSDTSTSVTLINPNPYTETTMNVYPNPAHDVLNIENSEHLGNDAKLVITNMDGKIHIQQKALNSSTVNVEALKPGVYHVQINNGNLVYHSIFIKQ
ncbi:MAG: T9SS type A sorting domain-containing protein, partial [Bacteroidales bacterium]|nr:T9SS type A sorting domain-containing protein [Bacteroidales bacterium]